MKSLEQLLKDNGFDVSEHQEDIMDNEYLLRSNINKKKEYVQKNLQRIFFEDSRVISKEIKEVIDKFINELDWRM